MPKLHLVGITPDHKGLVLSEYARAKRGDLTLDIDETLIAAIEEARRLRVREEGKSLRSAALPTRREEAAVDGRTGSALSPRDIQARIRTGHSIAAVAREAGVSEAWIERFAPPVLAEQVQMVEHAKELTLAKRGVGPSAEPLGRAVTANVVERGVSPSLADLESAWGAHQRDDGGWCITFSFVQRGRRQTAEWLLSDGDVVPRNRLATELGHRDKRSALAAAPGAEPAKNETKRPLRAKPKPKAPKASKASKASKVQKPTTTPPKVEPPKVEAPPTVGPPKVETQPEPESPRVAALTTPPAAPVRAPVESTGPLPQPKPPAQARKSPPARRPAKPAPAKPRTPRETPVKHFLGQESPAPDAAAVPPPAKPGDTPAAPGQSELDLTAEEDRAETPAN
jgi:DUF3071 family protein